MRQKLKEAFDQALLGIEKWLLRTSPSGYSFVGELRGDVFEPVMEQQSCELASRCVGAQRGRSVCARRTHRPFSADDACEPAEGARDRVRVERVSQSRYTCRSFFNKTASGLAAEQVLFAEGQEFQTGKIGNEYKLRGEVIEAFFYLHEVTKDPIFM